MKGGMLTTAALAAALMCVGNASAEGVSFADMLGIDSFGSVEQCSYCDNGCCDSGCCDGCCDMGCCGCGDSCCNCGGGMVYYVDLMFLKYHQSGGVQDTDADDLVGGGNNAEFDYSFSPRFTVGYESCTGFGVRGSYWYYDDRATTFNGTGFVDIEAYTVTVEFFKRIQLSNCTTIEGFGGFRYSEFDQTDGDGVDYGFDGPGGTVGFEVSHQFARCQRLYARSRMGVVQGDNNLRDEGDLDDGPGVGVDHQTLQVELALGWEGSRCLCNGMNLIYGAGAEFHHWTDAAVKADAENAAYLADAGWGGFTFRLGAEY